MGDEGRLKAQAQEIGDALLGGTGADLAERLRDAKKVTKLRTWLGEGRFSAPGSRNPLLKGALLELVEEELGPGQHARFEGAWEERRALGKAGNTDAMVNLGPLLYNRGDPGGAEDLWRRGKVRGPSVPTCPSAQTTSLTS